MQGRPTFGYYSFEETMVFITCVRLRKQPKKTQEVNFEKCLSSWATSSLQFIYWKVKLDLNKMDL